MTQFGPEYVRAIAPYQAGKPISEVAREFGLDEANIVKLASNENPFGVPESARQAMAQAAAELGLSRQALYRRMERLGIARGA